MKKKDFYYELPQSLIAQHPVEKRDGSRLLVLDGNSGDISHLMFPDIKRYLKSGDCLVLNNTKVIPARIIGRRKSGTAAIEVLLLKRLSVNEWETIVRPGRKMREGDRAIFIENELSCIVTKVKEDGNRIVQFQFEGIWEEILERAGQIPLPPYIHEQLVGEGKQRYQTVYAKHSGSSAAPTAGLHFTKEMLEEIKSMGVNIAEITLHIGLGTFRPVKSENIKDHDMHTESYNISCESAKVINDTKRSGGRIIAVGTTSSRVLESVADEEGFVHPCSGETNIFIYPGYSFKIIDDLITNFHLPESTLIMLVSAFAGKENTLNAYNEAIKQKYRFYSFGDAMFIKGKDKK